MKQLIAGICLCVGFGSTAYAHEKCEIRFLVDTPSCEEGAYGLMVKRGTVLTGVMEFFWFDASGRQEPYPATEGGIGCFGIERGMSWPQYVQYQGEKPTLAAELGPSCYIDQASRSYDKGEMRSSRAVELKPSTVSEAELREERLPGVFSGLLSGASFKSAAHVYVYYPESSCGLAARAILEGNKGAVDVFERSDGSPDSCGPIPTQRVSPRSKAPLAPTK